VKPDFWTDENIVELSIPARLLFIGMWNYACDNGHLQDKSKQLKMRVLPTDDVNCAELLREIEHRGLIERSDGWITIPNLPHHQKPHKRWYVTCDKPGCVLPEGASYGYPKRESTVVQPLDNGVTTVNNGCSTADVDVDVDLNRSDGDKSAAAKPRKRATRLPSDFAPNDKHRELASQLGVNLDFEIAKFRDYWIGEGKTKVDWDATLRNWIRNSRGGRPLAVVAQPDGSRVDTDGVRYLADGSVDEASLPPVEQSWMKRRPR
jgi:hypothetical protein